MSNIPNILFIIFLKRYIFIWSQQPKCIRLPILRLLLILILLCRNSPFALQQKPALVITLSSTAWQGGFGILECEGSHVDLIILIYCHVFVVIEFLVSIII